MRKALIGIIRLYQRYAPEDVRRRCLFMPTCSEYAILVLQKHGVIIGLLMIFDRLWYRCRGTIYRIDYP
ncbi:MAG: membrane protein insertion efficiency factor YidD [Geothrix sp.]|nr:membrane protein insertion efficiency factor YidD [Geothrix sp.]